MNLELKVDIAKDETQRFIKSQKVSCIEIENMEKAFDEFWSNVQTEIKRVKEGEKNEKKKLQKRDGMEVKQVQRNKGVRKQRNRRKV